MQFGYGDDVVKAWDEGFDTAEPRTLEAISDNYTEAQIHGGVATGDIAEVWLPDMTERIATVREMRPASSGARAADELEADFQRLTGLLDADRIPWATYKTSEPWHQDTAGTRMNG